MLSRKMYKERGMMSNTSMGILHMLCMLIMLIMRTCHAQQQEEMVATTSVGVDQISAPFASNSVDRNVNDEICQSSFWQEVEPNCKVDTEAEGMYRVMYGESTMVERWPYLVSLQRRLTTPFRGCYLHRCGATLIAPNVLLTAAHCIWSPNHDYRHPSIPNILAVEMYAALAPQCRHQRGAARIKISKYFLADDYSPELESRGGGDIALLQLEQPVNNRTAVFASIRDAGSVALEAKSLSVIGWGDTEADDAAYTVRELRMGTLQHVSASVCEAIMQAVSDGKLQIQSDKEICAYDVDVDSCDGDSGGPLLLAGDADDGTEDIQVGIVSWGPPGACGQTQRQLVGVYTRLSHYIEWIDRTMELMQITQTPTIDESSPQTSICETTINGCMCPKVWTFNGPRNLSGCANPDGDPQGPWCIIDPNSCSPGSKPAGDLTMNSNPTGAQYDYCAQECEVNTPGDVSLLQVAKQEEEVLCARTIAGCECKESWEVMASGEVFEGCANPDKDPRGTWCHYKQETCLDEPAGRGWDYCKPGCNIAQIKSQKQETEYISKDLYSSFQDIKTCVCLNIPNHEKYPNSTCIDYAKMNYCDLDNDEGYCECTCGTCQIKNVGG